MASAPPASESPETDRNAETAALALLLLGAKRRYDLPALIRSQRIKPRRFAQIRPTQALKSDLAAPYFDITRAWVAEVDALLAAYPGGAAAIEAQLGLSAARVEQIVSQAQRRFPAVVARIEAWHRAAWVSRVRASTNLDVSLFTQPGDVADAMQATTSWNAALADDVHRQTRNGIALALLAGAAASVPLSEAKARVADVIAKAKKRSAAIGGDQVDKLSRAMDRQRREAAGVASFIWHHSPHVVKPRPVHLARNGKAFANDQIEASDRAGVPYGCQCWEEPVL